MSSEFEADENQYVEDAMKKRCYYILKTGQKLDDKGIGAVLYHTTTRDEAQRILENDAFDARIQKAQNFVHFYNSPEVNNGDRNYFIICKLSEDAILFQVMPEDYGKYVDCGFTLDFEQDDWCKRSNDANILKGFGCHEQRELKELLTYLSSKRNSSQERKFEKKRKSRDKMILRDLHLPSTVEGKVSQLISGAEDDPPLIFDWSIQSLETFVTKINNYHGNFPCPFVLPVVLDTDYFRDALIEYWRGGVGAMPPKIGRVCLPCSASKAMTLMAFISNDAANSWWNDVNNVNAPNSFPLAYLYTLRARSLKGS
jgi:hypothetical protein